MRRVHVRAERRRNGLPRVRADDRADVADEEPNGERGEVDGALDVRVDVLGRGGVDGAVGEEDAEEELGSGACPSPSQA